MASTLVPSFFSVLSRMGIRQVEIARLLGCSESQVSRLSSGERSLPLEDLRGLLVRLCRQYPDVRAELVRAAVGPLLDGSGLELVVVGPPAPAPQGQLIELESYRMRRAA